MNMDIYLNPLDLVIQSDNSWSHTNMKLLYYHPERSGRLPNKKAIRPDTSWFYKLKWKPKYIEKLSNQNLLIFNF